jgi:hypothetical protein
MIKIERFRLDVTGYDAIFCRTLSLRVSPKYSGDYSDKILLNKICAKKNEREGKKNEQIFEVRKYYNEVSHFQEQWSKY